ncbi:hypothetical protein [Actinomadura gamaensis]|uniref:Uncharacterized protein n=1 Tax=Actinomadura gamaensis TaxID=1763541 RepID=A0ABV9U799_9ACTN
MADNQAWAPYLSGLVEVEGVQAAGVVDGSTGELLGAVAVAGIDDAASYLQAEEPYEEKQADPESGAQCTGAVNEAAMLYQALSVSGGETPARANLGKRRFSVERGVWDEPGQREVFVVLAKGPEDQKALLMEDPNRYAVLAVYKAPASASAVRSAAAEVVEKLAESA